MNNISRLKDENLITEKDYNSILEVDSIYPLKISKHLIDTIIETKSEFIMKQFLPVSEELDDYDGTGSYFPDEKHVTSSVVKKYPNRCIIYTTSECFANCRHCSRKAEWSKKITFSKLDFDKSIEYIRNSSIIEEVILTGGDALYNTDDAIQYMLSELSKIRHLKVIRIGTRSFTASPDRITISLCSILEKYNNVVIMTQFNHPDEFTKKTIEALQLIQRTGIPIFNQSVLLKGINDRYSILKDLLMKCASNRVIPYYLFHCFKVKGVQCYRTTVDVGENLVKDLVGNIGGWWIPRYIVIPHETGVKIPLCPNGILSREDKYIIVEDFLGRKIMYE